VNAPQEVGCSATIRRDIATTTEKFPTRFNNLSTCGVADHQRLVKAHAGAAVGSMTDGADALDVKSD